MSALWLAAAALTSVALAFFAAPAWREQRRTGRWPVAGVAAAVLVAPIALALYAQVRTWSPAPGAVHAGIDARETVEQLAERLARSPDDPAGWRMLARGYLALGEPERSVEAYREAWSRTPERDDELKLSFAEAQVLADASALTGEARALLDEVLASDPANRKALWYGGLAAHDGGDESLARARWSKLLELGAPPEIEGRLRSEYGLRAPAAPPADAAVKLRVRLGDGVVAAPTSTLFVFARAPGGGPPLAVVRRPVDTLPGELTLSDADSMIPGRSLAGYSELTIVARISASGQPVEQPGDYSGETHVAPGGAAEVVIERLAR